ncbi:hypothetical protein [Nocardioides sp.]|uniref:hypothetical protein n=1 Tax=Nocardioides sp. TaxID=35761 RepID=UPI0039E341FB
MSADDKASQIELLRAALRERTGNEVLDELSRASILSGVVGEDPDLLAVYAEETAPPQAEFDVHLEGGTVVGHETQAKPLGNFMRFASQAVNEIAKSISPIQRLGDRLIVEPGPGSVRLVMRVPLVSETDTAPAFEQPASVETRAIEVLADLFTEAEADVVEDSPLTAAVQRLSPKARTQLRLLAKTAKESDWSLSGEVRRRGVAPRTVTLTRRGAARLEDEAQQESQASSEAVMYGVIDGHIRSESLVSFIPEGQRRFKASVMDAELMNQVAHLAADEGTRVRAVFDVYERMPAGQSEVVRRSYTLKSVEAAPGVEHPALV